MSLSFPLRIIIALVISMIVLSSAYTIVHSIRERRDCLMAINQAEVIAEKSEMIISAGISSRELEINVPPDTELFIGGIRNSENEVTDVISITCNGDLRIIDSDVNFMNPVYIGPGLHTILLKNRNGSVEVKLIE